MSYLQNLIILGQTKDEKLEKFSKKRIKSYNNFFEKHYKEKFGDNPQYDFEIKFFECQTEKKWADEENTTLFFLPETLGIGVACYQGESLITEVKFPMPAGTTPQEGSNKNSEIEKAIEKRKKMSEEELKEYVFKNLK